MVQIWVYLKNNLDVGFGYVCGFWEFGPISVWPEETFTRLRYLLGGLCPIETVYLRLSLGPCAGKAQSQSQGTVKLHRVTNFLDLPALGRRQPPYMEAPLLPKLRGYFAEFLRESCLAPLGILYLPTLCRFWVQRLVLEHWLEEFSLPLLTLKKQGHLASLNR
ncbi:hypothetical protein ACB092_02G106400 [Castanea dentata]